MVKGFYYTCSVTLFDPTTVMVWSHLIAPSFLWPIKLLFFFCNKHCQSFKWMCVIQNVLSFGTPPPPPAIICFHGYLYFYFSCFCCVVSKNEYCLRILILFFFFSNASSILVFMSIFSELRSDSGSKKTKLFIERILMNGYLEKWIKGIARKAVLDIAWVTSWINSRWCPDSVYLWTF